ncbi:putative membrane protein [Deinococcus peraridilitoris DSM 19664]|uniref:Putative membrane protein n=2 Tax=Deinococcus TaxID=1298 RepID=L0A2H7_DEIPD|nr:putative membrane protein [Deinococcus peraridilitoris DSM 19664]
MTVWWVILGMGLVSLAMRGSSILFLGERRLPAWLTEALAFVPAAVLSALVLPELLWRGGHVDVSFDNARLWAGLLAIVVAWRWRNVLLTLLVGMLALWTFQAL